jgi:hypothetical protein
MKKIIMVKVGYFCMGQRMMWNNVVKFIPYLLSTSSTFVNYITKWKSISLHKYMH